MYIYFTRCRAIQNVSVLQQSHALPKSGDCGCSRGRNKCFNLHTHLAISTSSQGSINVTAFVLWPCRPETIRFQFDAASWQHENSLTLESVSISERTALSRPCITGSGSRKAGNEVRRDGKGRETKRRNDMR
eukprot:scaffold591664_cov17-Prasinocladus_malaysianus.AAC.1